jgi:hypothetical protein
MCGDTLRQTESDPVCYLACRHRIIQNIDGAGSKINRELESQQQPTNKARNKASADKLAAKQKGKCQLAAQGYNNARTKNLNVQQMHS